MWCWGGEQIPGNTDYESIGFHSSGWMQLEGRLDNRSMGEEGYARCYHSLSNSLPLWELCRLPWNWSSSPKRCRSMCEWHVRGGKSGEVLFEDAHRSLAVVSFIRISYQLGYWRQRWILDDLAFFLVFAHTYSTVVVCSCTLYSFYFYTRGMASFNSAKPHLRLQKWGRNIIKKCKFATSSPWFQAFCLNACVIFPIRQVPVQPFEFHRLLQIIHLKRLLTCTLRHRNASYCKALMVAITICFLLHTALESSLLTSFQLLSWFLWPLKAFVTLTATHTQPQNVGGMTCYLYHLYMQCHRTLTAIEQQRQTYCEGT